MSEKPKLELAYSSSDTPKLGASMPLLKCTRRVLSRVKIGKENLADFGTTDALLGHWRVTLFVADSRNFFLYMSERTLLSFILMEGRRLDASSLATAFMYGVNRVLSIHGFTDKVIARTASDYERGLFAGMDDPSMTGVMNALALDYQYCIEDDGGVAVCSFEAIIKERNAVPQKRLSGLTPFEATRTALSRTPPTSRRDKRLN